VKKLLTVSGYLLFTLLVPLSVFEGLYRWQVVDTYLPELQALNPREDLSQGDGRRTVLVMGDSFTAGAGNYPDILKQAFPLVRVVNGGVTGTGVIQAELMARNRFSTFHPSVFIYQIYVGNDLLDIRYPVNWAELSVLRNLYWLIANQLRSISYVNYRLGQIGQSSHAETRQMPGSRSHTGFGTLTTDSFSVEKYEGRVKLYFRAEPSLVEDSILLKGRRRTDYDTFLDALRRLVAYCEPGLCQAYLLVIPHASQVDQRYVSYMQRLGATFTEPDRLRASEYPFLTGIENAFKTWSHVHALNPLPILREISRKTAVYLANDEHLNQVGQEAIAEFLANKLDLYRSIEGLPKEARGDEEMAGGQAAGRERRVAPLSIPPMQLRVGDRFTDDRGEWEIVGRPYGTVGGKSVHARVRRVGEPAIAEERMWAAYERVAVRREGGNG
jgi:hypothetical protein